MTHRVIWGGALLLSVSLAISGSRAADDPPLFVKGQSYLFVSDCLPLWLAQMAALSMQAQGLNPCFVEPLTVVGSVRNDGWLEVRDPQTGQHWFVNTSHLYATQAYTDGFRAAR
mgnify:CR=1 FL=1